MVFIRLKNWLEKVLFCCFLKTPMLNASLAAEMDRNLAIRDSQVLTFFGMPRDSIPQHYFGPRNASGQVPPIRDFLSANVDENSSPNIENSPSSYSSYSSLEECFDNTFVIPDLDANLVVAPERCFTPTNQFITPSDVPPPLPNAIIHLSTPQAELTTADLPTSVNSVELPLPEDLDSSEPTLDEIDASMIKNDINLDILELDSEPMTPEKVELDHNETKKKRKRAKSPYRKEPRHSVYVKHLRSNKH
jgi:hypothetical protein